MPQIPDKTFMMQRHNVFIIGGGQVQQFMSHYSSLLLWFGTLCPISSNDNYLCSETLRHFQHSNSIFVKTVYLLKQHIKREYHHEKCKK